MKAGKRATLFMGDTEENRKALTEVEKLKEIGFVVDIWYWKDLGHRSIDPPQFFIHNHRCRWGPLLNMRHIQLAVETELNLARQNN